MNMMPEQQGAQKEGWFSRLFSREKEEEKEAEYLETLDKVQEELDSLAKLMTWGVWTSGAGGMPAILASSIVESHRDSKYKAMKEKTQEEIKSLAEKLNTTEHRVRNIRDIRGVIREANLPSEFSETHQQEIVEKIKQRLEQHAEETGKLLEEREMIQIAREVTEKQTTANAEKEVDDKIEAAVQASKKEIERFTKKNPRTVSNLGIGFEESLLREALEKQERKKEIEEAGELEEVKKVAEKEAA